MVDSLTPTQQVPDPTEEQLGRGGILGFLSTTMGKLIVGGVAVLILAGILGAIAVFFLFSQAEDMGNGLVIPPSEVTTQSPEATATPVQRDDPRLEDTFTFRNIFAPTVRPTIPSTTETTTPTGTGDPTQPGGVAVPEDTLFLESVDVVDGATVATFVWNGQTYVLGVGDEIDGTPWRVLSISGTTVTMLYGDTPVTLSVGQAMGK